ncbi:non-homologous end-joining factor 1 [Polymixia lowei]
MMESSGDSVDVLLGHPWLPVCISGCQLLAKAWFGDTAYRILLTDMRCVWEERMDSAAIQDRAQDLNKRLRAPVKAFFSHLREVAQPCLSGRGQMEGEAQMSLTRREDENVCVRLKSELAGLPFYWEFRCTPAPVTLVCQQLVRPLLAMSRLLQRQAEQLGDLLVRKDAEIQDYKENGATLSRERLQTEVFEEQTYREDFIAQAVPHVCSGQQEGLGFDADLQDLYTSIVAHGNARTRKRKPSAPLAPQDVLATEEREVDQAANHSPSPGEGSVSSEPGKGHAEQTGSGCKDTAGAKMADGVAEQQHAPVMRDPADRPASRPKKKKAVGLFR